MKKSILCLSVLIGLNAYATKPTPLIGANAVIENNVTTSINPRANVIETNIPITAQRNDKIKLPDVLNSRIKTDFIKPEFDRQGPTIQVAILLDTSGSMDGLIDQARLKIWDIINEISKANKNNKEINLEVALYEYGTSNGNEYTGFVKKLTNLTTDLDILSEKLFNLRTSGSKEYSGFAIKNAVERLSWSDHKDDLKLVIIAGNEHFRQGSVPYEYAINMAVEEDIIVNTIYCGDKYEGVNYDWKKASVLGNGKYLNISHNNKIKHVITPYDEDINRLGNDLNKTYKGYGELGQQKSIRQKNQDALAVSESASYMASRNVAKASSSYDTSDWDLTGKYEEDKEKAVELAKTSSDEYKSLSNDEIKKDLEDKLQDRKAIQKEIKELESKRSDFIKNETKVQKDDFGTALLKVVREQAENKDFNFK